MVTESPSTSVPPAGGKGRKKRAQQQKEAQREAAKSELQELWQHATTIYDVKGHVLQLATDQWGCRFVQLRLEAPDEGEANLIVCELLEHITDLSTDSYGNYVVQKMIEVSADVETRLGLIVDQLVGEVFRLSVHVYGCRVIQRAIAATCVPLPQQHALVISELKGRIQECVEDAHGNHVVQKIIEIERPVEKLQFIVDALTPSASWLAAHACGCRVLQRLLETCPPDMITKMRTSIVRSCAELSTNSFGNYVIQHVIVYGTQADRKAIYSYVMEDITAASCHKFSTNVVDKCLQHLTMVELAHVISVVLGDSGAEAASIAAWGGSAGEAVALSVMLRDRYGCAIVSRLLELAPSEMIERSRLVWKLKEQLPALRKSSFAKHLVAAVESIHAGSLPPVPGQFSRQLSAH
ncbi:pumilio, putative [Perkinsus marinus ATCC 50983]|uniref:Pumilio, putative n=1 Tax=Perkinsus marinus (strain ATCC 50983 / TXsc) TaxID=423536 RepID=C5K5A3_PERM5|nr:pumilio, putative [Perkinsus marinus ATCC 50983]EER20525.1 pumilio, putative [Perkinsus marinus ATCC 50983]|eukprot:XP_002788729.1 pumilio, putative [Perkinsus marinus ATCC 50983]